MSLTFKQFCKLCTFVSFLVEAYTHWSKGVSEVCQSLSKHVRGSLTHPTVPTHSPGNSISTERMTPCTHIRYYFSGLKYANVRTVKKHLNYFTHCKLGSVCQKYTNYTYRQQCCICRIVCLFFILKIFVRLGLQNSVTGTMARCAYRFYDMSYRMC